MKISKLFHWLYASLMLAPVFAVGVTCLTHVFNKETGIVETPKYETIDNTISFDSSLEPDFYDFDYYGKYVRASDIIGFGDFYTQYFNFIAVDSENSFSYYFLDIEKYFYINIYDDGDGYQQFNFFNSDDGDSLTMFSFEINQFKYFDFLVPSYEECGSLGFSLGTMTLGPVPYEDIPKMSVSSNEENIFYYSIDRLKESPYFNWAYNSFLFGPFGSITNIFSLPSNNIVSMLLSYWLALSVIWLVFDLIMYIPLLVHKWIDKAMIG